MDAEDEQVLDGVGGPTQVHPTQVQGNGAGRERGVLTAPVRDRALTGPAARSGARAAGPGPVVPSRWGRPLGVLVDGPTGLRWQRIVDVEGLVRLGIVAAAVVGTATAVRRPSARVDRLSMGPGGWVSFKGFPAPKARWDRRPWWARLLRARRVS